MVILVAGAVWAALVFWLLSRALRQFRTHCRSTLSAPTNPSSSPSVSIIIPARNEVENIGSCLDGLRAQTGLSPQSSITVVDDDSQDGTAAAVQQCSAGDPRVRLISAGVLPAGWIGKPHACWRGALLTEADWLCFVDADVRAAPQLVAAAVMTAKAQRIDLLSLHPLQELGSFWERTIMPAGLLVIACAKSLRSKAQDAANGQFLLIRRAVYFQVGGHWAVRADIAEDKALAGWVANAGFDFRVLSAEHLARTRMYRNLASLWEGLSKNATEILGSPILTLIAGAAALAAGWASLLLPAALTLAALRDPTPATLSGAALALLGSAVVIGIQLGTARHFRIPSAFGLIFVLGYTAVACLACHAVLTNLRGRVTWKGRTYQLAKTSTESP
ncbi:MAG: glycosyltransferase [Alphaproteobacteria bacterium]|nr:glycosyltransferase [Alphaproteobacteria bacterium]MBV9375874.1 glycosyltransferase [Alphaproteobacteria bacterium]MBV9814468.1 glycosyltransferase [Alphaproteobacteria bacterium]